MIQYPPLSEEDRELTHDDYERLLHRQRHRANDLLVALEDLTEVVGRSGWHNADPLPSNRQKRAALLNNARAAIAKAKGIEKNV